MFKSLAPTLSIVTAIIIVLFFAKPIFEEAKATGETVVAYNETIADYEDFIARLTRLEGERANVAMVNQAKLDQVIPEAFDIPQFLVNLERLSQVNNMLFGNVQVAESKTRGRSARVNAIATNAPTSIEGLETKDVTFEVIGTYDQFKSFLRQVESSLSFMEVTNISLQGSSERFQQYSITVQVYALPNN